MLIPVGQMIMAEAAGPERMGRVMGLTLVPMTLAPIFGPTLGGVLIDGASWRWIFFLNLPIALIAIPAAVRPLPRTAAQDTEALDVRGLLLTAGGLALLTYGVAEIGLTGSFTSVRALVPTIGGLALLAAFVAHGLRVPQALLNLRLYRRPTYSSAWIAMFFLAAALLGAMILMPLYWQGVRHESATTTGLLIAPEGLGVAIGMPIAGLLADRYGGGPIALGGALLTTLATIPFGLIGPHTSIAELSVAMLVRGAGIGLAFMPAMTAALASLDRSELPDALPQLNVVQRVGGSIGTAALAVILYRSLAGAHSLAAAASAYGTANWVSAAMTAVALIPCGALMLTDRAARAAAKMTSEAPAEAEEVLALA